MLRYFLPALCLFCLSLNAAPDVSIKTNRATGVVTVKSRLLRFQNQFPGPLFSASATFAGNEIRFIGENLLVIGEDSIQTYALPPFQKVSQDREVLKVRGFSLNAYSHYLPILDGQKTTAHLDLVLFELWENLGGRVQARLVAVDLREQILYRGWFRVSDLPLDSSFAFTLRSKTDNQITLATEEQTFSLTRALVVPQEAAADSNPGSQPAAAWFSLEQIWRNRMRVTPNEVVLRGGEFWVRGECITALSTPDEDPTVEDSIP